MQESGEVLLDLNNPVFQEDLLSLDKDNATRILATLRKLRRLQWTEVYRDKGLRWELVQSRTGPGDQRLYTIRVTQESRALVYREGQYMRFLSLHPDHDSAYK
jgi:DNA-binding MarR family transcriptional regulator